MSELQQFGDYNAVLNLLIQKSQSCPNFKALSEFPCAAQRLRVASQCPGAALPAGCTQDVEVSCNPRSLSDVSCTKFNSATLEPEGGFDSVKSVLCCKCINLTAIIAGSVVGGVALIVGIATGTWWYRRRQRLKASQGNQRGDQESQTAGQVPMSQFTQPALQAPMSQFAQPPPVPMAVPYQPAYAPGAVPAYNPAVPNAPPAFLPPPSAPPQTLPAYSAT